MAIAARQAMVGGWLLNINGIGVPVIDEEVSENPNNLEIRDGLGLAPFSIDIHCGQWGTITPLIRAVDSGMIKTGLGIDEDTMLEVDNGRLVVHGSGQVYRIQSDKERRLPI